MKIAINHTRFCRSGGIESYIFTLTERLLADGHEVHCFVRRWEPLEHERLHFHRVPVLPLGEGLKVLSFAYASAWLLQKEDFDVIHGFTKTFHQDVYTDGSGCFDEYLKYLRRASLWRRLTTFRPLWAFASRHIEKRRYQEAAGLRVVAMSARTRQQILARYSLPEENVEVLYNGVDTEAFHPDLRASERGRLRDLHATPAGALVLLFVGNDFRRKGLLTAIEAVARLGRPELVLWVLGKDRRSKDYARAARQHGASVRFLGSQAQLECYFAAADMLLFPSRFDVFGNAALEGLAAGLPAILSSRAGISEIVSDGVDCRLLRDPEDPRELAEQIRALLDPPLRARLSRAARATAERHDWELHFRRLEALYREVRSAKQTRTGRLPGLTFLTT